MKSFGPLFVNTIKLKHPVFPMFEWGWSQETEHPYRASSTCIVFWVPFVPRGYAFGIWGDPIDEDEAFNKVFKTRETEAKEIRKW